MQRAFASARPIAEAMEERILHSADLSPLQQESLSASTTYQTAPASTITATATGSTGAIADAAGGATKSAAEPREIVFIDAELSGIDSLLLDLQTQRQAGRPVDIVLIGASDDGITLISATLAGRSDIAAVHLLAHGGDGMLQLGSTRLDAASLLQRAGEIAGWGDALRPDADLMLYGCDVAGSGLGRDFARELAQLTGADVAASTDLTGAASLGGNWTLEYESGAIESAAIASSMAQQAWAGVLATYTADPTVADGATGSLRWAISQANANLGTDTIQLLAGSHRITLAGAENANLTGDFDIAGDLVLKGASTNPADTVVLVPSGVVDRVFDVISGTVSFSNLTITGGNGSAQGGALNITNAGQVSLTNMVLQDNSANNGGAVYNVGSVTMDRVRITGNTASTSGGGLNNRGVATLTDVEISGNFNDGSGGGISMQGGTASLTLNRVTISGNTAKANGGGIWGGGGTLSATNVTISGNTAAQGGGLYTGLDGYSISHSTIANNTATGGANAGGGIWTNPGPPPKQVTLTSTILASNTGGNANVGQISGGHNIDTDGTAIAAGGTDLNPTVAALKLGALLDMGGFTKTHLLMGGSVAINAGSLSAPATDQRGVARVGRADVGAFEFDGKLIVTTTADVVDGATTSISALLGNMGADGRISLREAIIAANKTLGADEITLPAGNYVLSLSGNDNEALVGDLDIIEALTIIGAGARTTTINANSIDRVFEVKGAAATLTGITVQGGSSAADGGAFLVSGGGASLTLRDSAISGNRAAGSGGAIGLVGTLVLDRVTIDGNTSTGGGADGGGGLDIAAGSVATLTNVTLTGNTATRDGGAIRSRGDVTIVNSTIAGNSGAGGGGIDVGGGSVSLRNTILANNTGGNAAGAITSLGHNIDSANTAGLTGTGDRINTNPLLGALQYNGGGIRTMAIGAGSAAVDGGTATGAPALDARGFLRITNDIGAYERNSLVVDTTSDVVDGTTSSIDALLANRGVDGRISLREAVIAANNTAGVDDISLPAGTYALSIGGADEDLAASGDLDVRDGVRITGAGAASTVVSGGGTLAVMQFVSGSSMLSGVSVASGYSKAGAAGIQIDAAATLAISQSVVRDNDSDDNGAGIVNAGNLTLTDVEVRDNTSSKDGGGLLNTGGTLTLNRVTLAGNSAVKGGGLQMLDGVASLTNVTVSHNTGSNKSGGLGIFGGSASLLNVTIADNQSASVGGLDHSSLAAGAITLRNVLFAGNQNGNIGTDDTNSSTVTSLGNNLSTSNSPELNAAGDRRNATANLGALGDWGGLTRTRPLLTGSAAINNGDTAAAPTTDQRGNVRVGNADIGAFEFSGAANAAPVLDTSKAPALNPILGGSAAPIGSVGTRVFRLVDEAMPSGQVDNVSDADAGALLGIAVIGVDSTNGSAWWSIDNGDNWSLFGSVTPGTARLLIADGPTRVYYQPAAGFTGTLGSVLTIRAWDRSSGVNGGTADSTVNGGSTAFSVASDTVSLLVAAPPVVVTSSGSLAYTENAAPSAVDPTLTVSDADSATLVGATVSITTNHASSEDVLAFVDQPDITGSWDAATGVLSLTGSASVADYQAALRSVTYANTSESPSTLLRTIAFVVNDGAIASAAASRTVAVTSVNDAPVVTTSAGTLAYTENDAAIEVDPALVVTDVDHGQLASASVTIAANHRSDQDSLLFTDQFGITGSWNAATGVLDLTGSASVAAYEAALRSVRYVNTSEMPAGAPRTIAFVVSDGVTASAAASRTVSIAGVNDAPQVTTTAGTLAYVENAGAVLIDANLSIADADDANLAGATVRITANHAAAQDRLVFSDQSGISGLFDAATGVLTLSGSASVAAYQAALRSVAYANDSDAPSTLARTISFSVDDGTSASAAATRIVSVAAVNDAPVVSVPAGQTTLANNAVVFSAANGNAITIGDADAAATSVQLTLSATNGSLTLGTLAGLSFSTGDGTSDATVRFTGTLGAINAALSGLRFDPTANVTGTAVLTIDASDLGNSGSGGALEDIETIPIEVLSGNTAPVLSGANAFESIAEDATGNNGTLVSTLIATRVTDADAGALSGIAVTAVDDTQGQWQFSSNGGTSWTAFGTPTASSARLLAADANTRVRFVPAAHWNGSVINGISFRAWDQRSGTAGGTADTTQANPVVRDEFTTPSYANNDSATASWSGSWIDSDGSASSGQISIGSGRMNFAGSLLSSSSVQRQVNLAGATGAMLSFDFSSALGLSTLTLEASRNGGASWTTLQNTWPNGSGTATANLSSFLSATTRIRFTISGVLGGGNFSVDNLQIAWTKPLNGGSTAFSSAIFSSGITVTPVNDAATGVPTVSGSATENQTLSAGTSGLADIDGLRAFAYQWLRGGVAISGAMGSTLLLGDADVGSAISVRVSWTDAQGSAESVTSAATALVAGVNDAPTGLPTINGSVVEDGTLSANVAGIADVDGLGTFSYQWLRNGSTITDATGSTLVLGDADVGQAISVRVDWTDGQGTAESLTSAQTTTVANVNDVPTGAPTITGSAVEDQTLSAVTSGLADADGLRAFSYQWLRNGSAISGAISSSLPLGDADVGQAISVRVDWTDGNGTAESVTSAATAPVANVNDAPTGLPTIAGSAAEYQTLTAITSGVADADGLGAFSHQWLRNGVAISGATGSSLVLGAADIGARISVRVSWTDGHGSAEAVTSAQTAPVANVNDAPTGSPSITGSVTEDATLGIDTSAIADIDGLNAFSYQWLRDGSAITGAIGSTLELGDADVGQAISVRVDWTDGQGTAESLTSAQTAVVANVNDVPTGAPTITGSAVEDQTLSAVTSGLADADGLRAFSYQWLRNGSAISGAISSSLLLGDADVGQAISVRVDWTDGNGTAESVTSAATASVANVNDAPTGVPTISGSAAEYQMLTAITSGVADADGLGAFSHQWLRNGVAISGATGSSLVLGAADIGARISVRVNWTDAYSTAESATSGQTALVTNVNDPPTGSPSITGSVTEDATLGIDTSAIADIDGLNAFSYQWLRDGSAIIGATSSTLLLGDADVGKRISVRVNWTDGQNTAESLTSVQTTTVANVNDVPTGLPTISGSVIENQTLSAVTSGLADADGLGAFSYQWLRNGSAISGATASTLRLGDADVGQSMSVRVNWTDGNGTAEALTSAATAPVTNVNDAPRGSNASLAVTRNGSRMLVAADFGFADFTGESNALQSVRVLLPSAGTLRLAGTLLSATTEVTRAQLDAGALVYAPVTGGSGSAYATIGFQVRDDGGTANGGADLDPVVRLLTIDIVNRAPTITSDGGGATATQTVAENTIAVTTVSATDADGDALTYSIVGGADAARLRIDASTGALRFVVPPNAEAPIDADADNVYRVTVRASDGVSNDEQALSVRVTDVVEAIQNTFETRVNTTTGDAQLTAMANRGSTRAVALAPDGSHVVVWSSLNQDGSGWGVYGQRFDKAGAALGGEFRVNQTTAGDQFRASVATDAAGNFVVAWTTAPGSDGMRARVYGADGNARSGEIQVNTVTTGNQTNGSVAMDANGNFIVVWQGPGPTDGDGIFARRFDASGAAIDGTEFRVNADLLRPHYDAAVSMNASGAFAIAWDNGVGVQLRRYAADGSALGGQVVVSNASTAANPALALADDGVLQVVWRETAVDQGVYLQRYSAAGALLGSRVVVNTVTDGNQTEPSIAVDGNGRFVVAWEGIGAADDNGVFLQKFDASGVRIGANVLVNQTTVGAQNRVSVAMLDPDNLVAVWSGSGTGDSTGVFMRQFGSLNTAPRISGVNLLASVAEDSTDLAGTLVSALLAGRVSDPDPGALTGIAVVGVDDSRGAWQYSVDGGTRWAALGLRSDASARLLAADALTRVRFVPAPHWHGSLAGLSLRAWDRTSGSADTLADASVNGGMSAFSSQAVVASITVTPVNNVPTGTPTITGAAVEDGILTLDTSGIADRDGLGAFAIQWLRDGVAVAGANSTTFQLGDADVGRSISVRVGWTDGDGTAEALTSAATAPIANVNDAPTGLPTITGSAVEDATLTAIVSGIADADGLGSFSRQWLRDGVAVAGATGAAYTLGDADVGSRIGVRVSWTDGNGSAEVLTSAATVPVLNINDVPTGLPTIAGSAVEDSPLSAVVTTIRDADGLGTFAWQWLRDGAAIAGATGSTFVPGDVDVGRRISVRVDWTDGQGTAETLTSAATSPVANVNDVPTGTPAITGSAIEDGRLGIDTRAIGDADGLGGFALQWLRDGTAIDGATGTSLLLGDADVGRSISVRVSWIDGHGTAESLTSAGTTAVVNVNDAPVLESPLRDRRAVVGEPFVLAVPDATFSDIDAGDSLVLSATKADGGRLPAWLRFDAATRSISGTPERGDAGETLIRLQATDSAGASVFDEIRVEVVLGNAAPIAGRPVGDQQALEDAPFTLVLAADTFVDTDHRDVLELRASLASGEALPSWLGFDAATATFSGLATNNDVGSLRIRIVATDLVGATGTTEFTLRVVDSNDAPAATALPDQRVREDEPLRIVVPTDAFSDVDAGDALTFSARLVNGAALPAWLRFDAATLTFSGTPGEADNGAISIRVTATDNAGASAASDFTLTVEPVNDAPVLAAPLPSLQVDQGGALSWTMPADQFTDVDAGDALAYSATLASGAALPSWLRFDAATRTLSGVPAAGDIGLFTLRIVATDGAGTSAVGELLLTVRDVNDAPVLRGSAALPPGFEDAAGPAMRVSDLIAGHVTDDDAGALVGIAVIAADSTHGRWQYSTDGATWLELGAPTARSARLLAADDTTALRFIPAADWHGDVAAGLVLRAWDRSSGSAGAVADASAGGGTSAFSTATATVALQVRPVNDEPVLVKGPADQSVTAGQRLELVLAEGAFADRDTGDVLRYRADLSDGKPLPDWLQFDAGALTFKGSPSAADIEVMTVRVTATDASGASAQALFVIDIQQAPEEPRGRLLTPEPLPKPETAVPAPAVASEPARREQTIADEPATPFTPARQLADVDTSLPEFAALSAPAPGGGVDRTPPPANRADAVLATLPAAVFSELKVDQTLQLLRSEELLRRFDDLKHQMKDLGEEQRRVMASSLAITSGLSIGYVVWLVRGGVLVSSMLSALPAWQLIDPMPVLAAAGAVKKRLRGAAGMAKDGDEQDVEELFDGQEPEARPVPPTRETRLERVEGRAR